MPGHGDPFAPMTADPSAVFRAAPAGVDAIRPSARTERPRPSRDIAPASATERARRTTRAAVRRAAVGWVRRLERPMDDKPASYGVVRALGFLGVVELVVAGALAPLTAVRSTETLLGTLVVMLGLTVAWIALPARFLDRRVAAFAFVSSIALTTVASIATGGPDSPYHIGLFAIVVQTAIFTPIAWTLAASALTIAAFGMTAAVTDVTSAAPLSEFIAESVLVLVLAITVSRLAAVNRQQVARLRRRTARIRRLAAELAYESRTDVLTGLGNRRAFDTDLADRLARGGPTFHLVLADLDQLKPINDRYGHGAGDAALATMAARLRADLGPGDAVYRIGGDEFAVLLAAPTRPAERDLHSRITAELPEGGTVTASLGSARSQRDDIASWILSRADVALYRSKRANQPAA